MSAHGDYDLGHTAAGWTGTAIATAGFTAMGVAFAARSTMGLALGGSVVALAVLATWFLHLAGWGKATGPRPADQQHWRVRDAAAQQGHPDCLGCRLAGRNPAAVPAVAIDPTPAGQLS